MGIVQTTPQQEIDDYVERHIQRIERAAVRALCYVGEEVLNAARKTRSYKDQTGNLRSSTGYVVVVNGEIVKGSSFKTVKQGAKGSSEGEAYIRQLVSEVGSSGIVLIVVAGMNYARYVSSKGYDVLDSAELLAQKLIPIMLKSLKLD